MPVAFFAFPEMTRQTTPQAIQGAAGVKIGSLREERYSQAAYLNLAFLSQADNQGVTASLNPTRWMLHSRWIEAEKATQIQLLHEDNSPRR